MKIEIKKVYYCEFCSKHSLSAAWISRHEKHCQNRPENRHKCFDQCSYLKKYRYLINVTRDPENRHSYKTVFTCAIKKKNMYSYLIEKKINFDPKFIKGLIRMPIECKDHKYMTDSELEERFHIEI